MHDERTPQADGKDTPWRAVSTFLPRDGSCDPQVAAAVGHRGQLRQDAARLRKGLDIVRDGEQSRQHFVHGFLEQVDGIDFEHKVKMGIRDNRYDAMVPQVVSALRLKGRGNAFEAQLARAHTKKRLKFTLPGPMGSSAQSGMKQRCTNPTPDQSRLQSALMEVDNPTAMHALRHITILHHLVLAWFLLSLGVAIAGPVLHPQSMELVCSSAGSVKVIVHTDDGAQEQGRTTMDCPLCAATGAPPSIIELQLPALTPLAHAVQSIPSARIAAATKAPLPARGPPSFS